MLIGNFNPTVNNKNLGIFMNTFNLESLRVLEEPCIYINNYISIFSKGLSKTPEGTCANKEKDTPF